MTATDSTLAVQRAVVSEIRNSAALGALMGDRVYDRAPQNVAFPFVQIAQWLSQPALETQSGEGFEHSMTLHIWSRSATGIDAAQIAAELVNLFNNATPTLTGGFTVVKFTLADQRRGPRRDENTTQIIQRWDIWTDS